MSQANLPDLADYRAFMRLPASYTQDDAMICNDLIPAALDAVRAECGDIVPKQYEEYYDGGDFSIWLRHKPLLSVQMVEEGWGFTNYVLDEVEVNASTTADMFAFSVDLPESGKISRRSGGNANIPFIPGEDNIHVIYTAGLDTCPGGVRMFLLTLVAYWYQNLLQRQLAGGASQYSAETIEGTDAFTRSQGISTRNMGVPAIMLEMLKQWRRAPIIG